MWKKLEKQCTTAANTDTEPFLSPSEEIPGQDQPPSIQFSKRTWKSQSRSKIWIIHAITIAVNVILAAILLFRVRSSLPGSTTEPYMYAKDAVRYKKTYFLSSIDSPLAGPPSPEIDAAWNRLLDDASLRLTENELSQFNSSSIDLQESWGKLAWLEVSHQVHCMNYIRKALHRNHYHAELTDQEWQDYILPHVDHCLNDLVQNVMCQGNTIPKFFEWERERVKPVITSNYHLARTCVDLDYLKDSLKDRVVSHTEMRRLKNPLLNR